MLYIIGLGLNDEKDITVKGLEAIQKCDAVFLEAYTSILISVSKEEFYGKPIFEADRNLVESECEKKILDLAKTSNVAFLVVGDPFGATTHSDLLVRAKELGIDVQVIHNASIMNACACCGLQLYRFGQSVSIVFFEENWRPDSFYDKILENRKIGLHTLCLLDIKMKEQTVENLLKRNKIFEPPRFMSINLCIEELLEVEAKRKQNAYSGDTMCVGMARVGAPTQQIVAGKMSDLLNVDFGGPLHSFIICADDIHIMEMEQLKYYAIDKQQSMFK